MVPVAEGAPVSGLGRRDLLALAALAGGAVALPRVAGAAGPAPAADSHFDATLTRIGFGSCAKQDKEQPIWSAIEAARPDLFIMLGDNVYGDTRDMAVLAAKYRMLGDKPGFQRVRSRLRTLAIWDDHDFGEDDAGGDYPCKLDSQRIFCDFWGEAPDSPRRRRDGIYVSYVFGSAPRRVQVIMPDLRFNRTPIRKLDLGGRDYDERAREWAKEVERTGRGSVPGPYERIPDRDATMLGEPQWRWLEAQLQVPAEVRILASSLQVVADFAGWEGWINYAHDHQRLVSLIRRHRANGLVCISGDTHYAELSRLDANAAYPLWDITSSGLTEVWPVLPPNALRTGDVLREPNFGMLEIDWSARHPLVIARVRDIAGKVSLEQRIDTAELRV
jgi:alkaline phosphatase D